MQKRVSINRSKTTNIKTLILTELLNYTHFHLTGHRRYLPSKHLPLASCPRFGCLFRSVYEGGSMGNVFFPVQKCYHSLPR